MPLTVGTAGHIDHGKTWLVRALTGKDTDRLPEEKARGISIDLGYAQLELPGGRRLSLIDVPGHERFVRNMVAGATGIDLFLLVIDAGEGARPQTHEHLAILRLLGIDRGVVAVTKADAVDGETLEIAVEAARELVPGTPVVAVSAKSGQGLDDLRDALAAVADEIEPARQSAATRLYVDRIFTLRGIGTVVTGTLWSGSISAGDELRVEPRGLDVRVRSVQVHDRPVEVAEAGQRVAVSLPGVQRDELARGDALVAPGHYPVSYRLDVRVEELAKLPAAVTVHLGTADVPARIVHDGRYAHLRLTRPVVAARGDRVVLRTETTVGGGVVLDPSPPRRRDPARLELLERGDPASIVRAIVREPVTAAELQAHGLLSPPDLARGLSELSSAGDFYFALDWLEELKGSLHERLAERASTSPLDPGIPFAELLPAKPWALDILRKLPFERRGGRAYLPGSSASLGEHEAAAKELEGRLGLEPVKIEDQRLARFLEEQGRLVRLGGGSVAISPAAYEHARQTLVAECERAGSVTLARFRDLLGVGRRTAQLLLERFDADGLTRRVGEARVIRRAAQRRV